MRTVLVGGEYYRQYDSDDAARMTERWRKWIEDDIQREWRFVRYGLETRDGQMSWQVVVLALILPWALGLWLL